MASSRDMAPDESPDAVMLRGDGMPVYDKFGISVFLGDCLEIMRTLPDASMHSVVTDPPYGLEFMGREWDTFKPASARLRTRVDGRTNPKGGKSTTTTPEAYVAGHPFQEWCKEWATECLRVLKPGGHMLAFGGTRTFHRLTCAIEDAGFEIRDTITWLYGQGFSKSLNVSKAIDKAADAEREVVGENRWSFKGEQNTEGASVLHAGETKSFVRVPETAPATDAARRWAGWGTALKPAHEPIIVARKPLTGTVAANVLEHGTGAIDVDATRVGTELRVNPAAGNKPGGASLNMSTVGMPQDAAPREVQGRWPTNVVLYHAITCTDIVCCESCPVAELDAQSGNRKAGGSLVGTEPSRPFKDTYGVMDGHRTWDSYGDSGGASRFFPVFRWEAKAPLTERPRIGGKAHPTVKPLSLMRWLCRLITPPGGTVLDCFAGTGTTGHAARAEGFRAVLIEKEADHIALIVSRLDGYRESAPIDEATGRPEPMDLLDLLEEESA